MEGLNTCLDTHTHTHVYTITLDAYIDTVHLEENSRRKGEIELERKDHDSRNRCLSK